MELDIDLISKTNVITDGDPVKTGRTFDGKNEYIKRISLGNLPNAGIDIRYAIN